ncbi:hypothetical protein, partial [Pseudophaeobacter profundi]|uniref:hypothetical protein n=1 Tax=Pseudophaeobacter profundi TaxID=3034152 RepID=UPI002431F05D
VAAGISKESGPIERMEEEVKEADYVEDSDGNLWYLPEKNIRKTKLMHYQKKLEKKEKLVEAKIDQRLEKLEMKRKKLMEKYSSHKMLSRKPALDAKSA